MGQWGFPNTMDLESIEEGKIRSERKLVGGTLSGYTEATISRDTFGRNARDALKNEGNYWHKIASYY